VTEIISVRRGVVLMLATYRRGWQTLVPSIGGSTGQEVEARGFGMLYIYLIYLAI
jgi:hypothetical protein